MELGPIQTKWVSDLREFADRQIGGELGRIDKDGVISCCCLGQALLTLCEFRKDLEPNYIDNTEHHSSSVLKWLKEFGETEYLSTDNLFNSFEEIGLYSEEGAIHGVLTYNNSQYTLLTEANDSGVPWDVIADFIENNPEKVFNESI